MPGIGGGAGVVTIYSCVTAVSCVRNFVMKLSTLALAALLSASVLALSGCGEDKAATAATAANEPSKVLRVGVCPGPYGLMVEKENFRVSRATLYNTIVLLLDAKLLIKHVFSNNTADKIVLKVRET